MGDVVNIEANLPHYVGHAMCCECGHYWVSVFPTTATALECPKCSTFPTVRVFIGDITEVKLFGGRVVGSTGSTPPDHSGA